MILFIFFSHSPSCRTHNGVVDDLETKTIKDAKSFSEPETNIVSSVITKQILAGFSDALSKVLTLEDFYFPDSLTYSYAVSDVLSFFRSENIWLSSDFCYNLTCPNVSCGRDEKKMNIEIQGNCFNEVFDLSGKIVFEEFLERSDNSFFLSYTLSFKDWYFRDIATDESVFYVGDISFSARRIGEGRKSIRRKISVRGSAMSRTERVVDFRHEFAFESTQSGDSKNISFHLVDYRNELCYIQAFGEGYLFTCERSFQVEKLGIVVGVQEFFLSGESFTVIRDRWLDARFSLRLLGERCHTVSGSIEVVSGGERLILEYQDRHYGDRVCDLSCPTRWIWLPDEGRAEGMGCLP